MTADIIRRTQEMIEVMQAFVRGETIEVYMEKLNEWRETKNPCWDWNKGLTQYRVKPKSREIWLVVYKDESLLYHYTNLTPELEDEIKLNGGKITKFVAVIEENNG